MAGFMLAWPFAAGPIMTCERIVDTEHSVLEAEPITRPPLPRRQAFQQSLIKNVIKTASIGFAKHSPLVDESAFGFRVHCARALQGFPPVMTGTEKTKIERICVVAQILRSSHALEERVMIQGRHLLSLHVG